ncbi:MAG: ABC transporter permease [Nitrososphaerota archaeon]|nr:ABC transporter permease [Nitrososphaerota archaeon]
MRLYQYVGLRALIAVGQLVVITAITFVLSRLSGNPIAMYIEPEMPISAYPLIEKEYHLTGPLYSQYFYYLGRIFSGNLGISRSTGLPVTKTIEMLFPWTLELAVGALLLSFLVGVPVGIYSAWKKSSIFDSASNVFASFGTAIPQLVIGLLLIILLYFIPVTHGLPGLPSSGGVSAEIARNYPLHSITGIPLLDSLLTGNYQYFSSSFAHIIMPVITLSLFPMGFIINTVRSHTSEILNEDFVLYLRSAGLSARRILFRHILKHNLVYLITIAALLLSTLIGGTVVVETIFGWPGLGLWAAQSIYSLDVAGILGFTIVVSLAFIIANLCADIVYPLVDPRIRS